MALQKRHRPCGNCDCRDVPCAGEFPQRTPICCSECPEGKSPCQYVAHFGCNIISSNGADCLARAHELLMRKCEFEDTPPCAWYGLGYGYDCDSDIFIPAITGSNPYWTTNSITAETLGIGCTWTRTRATAAGEFILLNLTVGINEFGWGWELDLADGGATFFYGNNEYSVATWVCDGVNTLTKVSGDSRLPDKVCITPWWFGNNVLPDGYAFNYTNDSDQYWAWKCPCTGDCAGTAIMETRFNDVLQLSSWVVRSSECSSGCYAQTPLIAPDLDLYGPETAGYEVGCGCVPESKQWILNDCDVKIPCGYDSEAARCACGDDCCDQAVSFTLVCGAETATISGTAVASDVEGTCGPVGRSIMIEDTVTFGGTSYDIKFVMYCDGADWLVDVYCDGVLDQSCLVSTFTKCPFSATVTIPELSCMVCGVDTDCCPDDPIPTTITADDGDGHIVSLTWNGTCWGLDNVPLFAGITDADVYLCCTEGALWYATVEAVPFGTSGSCSPFERTGTYNGYTITYTA